MITFGILGLPLSHHLRELAAIDAATDALAAQQLYADRLAKLTRQDSAVGYELVGGIWVDPTERQRGAQGVAR